MIYVCTELKILIPPEVSSKCVTDGRTDKHL